MTITTEQLLQLAKDLKRTRVEYVNKAKELEEATKEAIANDIEQSLEVYDTLEEMRFNGIGDLKRTDDIIVNCLYNVPKNFIKIKRGI